MTRKIYPFYFIAIALGIYIIFTVVPSLMGIYLSFTDWNSYSREIHFIGLDNFKTIFSSNENYMHGINNTVIFTISTIILKTMIGLLLAILVNKGIRLKNFHRVILFLPAIIPMLVVGIIFKSIFNPEYGLINETLRAIGLDQWTQHWLTDVNWAFKSIIAVDVWKGAGYIMVILLAGIQAISHSYYEAADIDGAGAWKKFRFITVPLLMPALMVTTVLNLLYGLKIFDTVYVLTNGGPGYATDVVYTQVFGQFTLGSYGVGTALITVLFLIMSILGYFAIKLMSREEQNG
ncbi:carbohydrate ABC transporter permease [Cohnella lupini]|uniref:Carbohydrate ABC transporter membrane protein 1 (CUT1 family) n=1 Tax=Cohnella lupini TaxID=1294267 RepID=A0A3D9IJQ1_9BACL|nr:sugar ABC transporter permease [Cohnella lupini]RED61877.1 carbohydrate ABC transporter membrane protein 1 (CUT1 family) [Cohnella lupini]